MVTQNLIGLIPAAGKGIRLGLPYPKELYPIIRNNRYKPVSQFVLENLVQSEVAHCVFIINGSKHQLIDYFGSGRRFNCNISYVAQDIRESNETSTSPGLAHALDSAYHLTIGKVVCFGMPDTIMKPRDIFRQLITASSPQDQLLVGLFHVNRPEKSGMVQVDDNGIITAIVDKPLRTELKWGWGCLVWRPEFTDYLHAALNSGQSDFACIMNSAIRDGLRARGIKLLDGEYTDLGTYDDIMELDHSYRAPLEEEVQWDPSSG